LGNDFLRKFWGHGDQTVASARDAKASAVMSSSVIGFVGEKVPPVLDVFKPGCSDIVSMSVDRAFADIEPTVC
jgi:hypothetical protein